MKTKYLFFCIIFFFFLLVTENVFAGALGGPSINKLATEQGWLSEKSGSSCKNREPKTEEIKDLEKYCNDMKSSTYIQPCLGHVESIAQVDWCSEQDKKEEIKNIEVSDSTKKDSFLKNIFSIIINFFKSIFK